MLNSEGYCDHFSKFQTRINRLYNILNSDTSVLFIIDNYELTEQTVLELVDTLKKCNFKAVVKLLIIKEGNDMLLNLNMNNDDFYYVADLYRVTRWLLSGYLKTNINYKVYAPAAKNKSSYYD